MLGHMRRIAGLGVGTLVLVLANDAAADGERTPMFGASMVWETSTMEPLGAVGVGLEAAWWLGRLGLAVEGSGRSWIEEGGARAPVLGASLRLRLLDAIVPSVIDGNPVELGLELQVIAEYAWSSDLDTERTRQGFGVALRLRGSGDDDESRHLAESRFFVRVLSAASRTDGVVARTMSPIEQPREWIAILGIGAAFGLGEPRYLERFRRRPLDWAP